MGLFDFASNLISDVAKSASNIIQSGIDLVYHPASSQQTTTAGKQIISQAENTAATILGAATGASALGLTTKAVEGFSSASTLTQAKIIGGSILGAPLVTGVAAQIAQNPQKIVSGYSSYASKSANFAGDLTNLGINPTMSNAKSFVTEHPIGTAGLALGGAGLIGYGLSNTISTIINTSAVRKNTEATMSAGGGSVISGTTNKYDVKKSDVESSSALDIAKLNNEAQIKMAKIQADSQEFQTKAQLKALELQSKMASSAAVSNPPLTSAAQAPKSKKKPTKKKKKATSKKKKAKTIKRKATNKRRKK